MNFPKVKRLLVLWLAASFGAAAQDMRPNKEPVPSPSDLRAATGEDRPHGEAREARTPSPSDLAVERPRVDGDRWTSGLPEAPSAAAGGTAAPAPSPSDLSSGSQIR
jgi:hypothetical protein